MAQQRSGDTEARILDAAKQTFLKKGKDGARMQDIARVAGINPALLHYYFRSKDRLYETVLRSLIREFIDLVLSPAGAAEDFPTFLRGFIDNYIDVIAEHTELTRFILWELERGGSLLVSELRKALQRRGMGPVPFQAQIRAAIEQGEIRPLAPEHLILSIIGMCVYPFLARPIVEKLFQIPDITSQEFREQRKEEVFRLLWYGLQKKH